MKVFIAGHRGLVGSAVIRNAPDGIEVIRASREELDLRDRSAVKDFLKLSMPEAVILAAAKVGGIEANSRFQSNFLVENIEIQNSVITAAANLDIQNLIFLGSSCVYPKFASQPIKEESLLTGLLEQTNEGYALAKIAGIKLVQAIYNERRFKYISLMPTNLYGPNDNFDVQSSHVPAAFLRRFHEAKISGAVSVDVWGTGKPRREFMHVDDLARACWFMLDKNIGGELINIGTGIDISISEFARLVSNIVGYNGLIKFDESKPDGTPQKLLDTSKANSLGWHAQITLERGLAETYNWYINALKLGEIRGI